ncbi:hypothetical protein [Kineosporia sp. NBRC 101731]|uniref:DUF6912 family protein n=1 Tax=Kineosporia sp. NBRC 101731 TaxID=3032199 RepID=UPI0024A46B0C|nr:hypothetical protein [Kineosporia sp. NBRC 101731]GLY28415.1 hypothetical protein Kisp02_17800 [Kineosporia sp. NBRC 101731]
MTRVYVPTTLAVLAETAKRGVLNPDAADSAPLPAHAVTAAIREWYTDDDVESLEFAALTEAAEASLRMLAEDPAKPRRVVLALDVPPTAVRTGGPYRSSVTLEVEVPLADVVSLHIDESEAEDIILAGIAALTAADGGDEDAMFVVEEAGACDLLWYDISEIDDLISD